MGRDKEYARPVYIELEDGMNQENNNYEPTPGFRPVAPDPASTDNSKAISIAAAVGFFVTAAICLYLAVTGFTGFIDALEYGGGFYASASLLKVPIYLIIAAGCVITGLYLIIEMNTIIGAIGPAVIAVGCLFSIILEGYIVVLYQSPAYLGMMAGFLLYAAAAGLLAVCVFTGNRKFLGAGRYIAMGLALLAFIVLLVRYITFWTDLFSFGYYGGASYFSMYGANTIGDIALSLGLILMAQLLSQKPERYLPKADPSSPSAYMYAQQPVSAEEAPSAAPAQATVQDVPVEAPKQEVPEKEVPKQEVPEEVPMEERYGKPMPAHVQQQYSSNARYRQPEHVQQPEYRQQYNQSAPEYGTRYAPNPVYGIISNARVFGILSIVGAFVISIAGLILGIVGMNKVKNLAVPPEMEYERQKAYNLNKIGFILAIVFIGLSILMAMLGGCISAASAVYYY